MLQFITASPPSRLSTFLPASATIVPLYEVAVDLSGRTLQLDAELSVVLTSVAQGFLSAEASAKADSPVPGDTFLIARVERLDGVPHLVAVALADVVGDRLVSRVAAGLGGIRRGGRYVFYRATSPIGFLDGTATAAGNPVAAIVQTAELPFIAIAIADAAGRFMLPASAGSVTATARVPRSALARSLTLDCLLDGEAYAPPCSDADGVGACAGAGHADSGFPLRAVRRRCALVSAWDSR